MTGEKENLVAEGLVALVECTGDRTILEVQIGENKISVSSSQRLDLQKGSMIQLAIEPGHCHIFQKGERVEAKVAS